MSTTQAIKSGLDWTRKVFWPLLKDVLLWRPLGQAAMPVHATDRRVWIRHILWEVALRASAVPVLVVGLWLIMLLGLSSPARQAPHIYPEQFGLTCQDVSFRTHDGINLQGWYLTTIKPSEVVDGLVWKRKRPGVVICHGYGATRDQWLYPVAQRLVEAGYDVLLFDFRGHGFSDDAAVSFGPVEAADVMAAVSFLSSRVGVDPERIGIFGSGMGAYAAMLAAPYCHGVKVVVAESAYPSVDQFLRRRCGEMHLPSVTGTSLAWGLSVRFGYELLDNTALEAVRNFGDRGLLLINGSEDVITPPEDMTDLLAAAEDVHASRMIVSSAVHGRTFADPATIHVVTRFFDRYLAEPDAAGPNSEAALSHR